MTDMYQKCDAHRNNSFELYGFDILIDETLRPWYLSPHSLPRPIGLKPAGLPSSSFQLFRF